MLESALARYPDVRHLIVTCNRDGRIVEDFRHDTRIYSLVLDDAVNDRGLAMTSSFTNMVVAGQCLAHLEDPSAWAAALDSMVSLGDGFLAPAADAAAELAEADFTSVCFLGKPTTLFSA